MNLSKIVIGTDVLEEHVRGARSPSVLRMVMKKCLCYTTVFNAIELFAGAGTERERQALMDALGAMKILGLNSRQAMKFGELFRRHTSRSRWDLLVAGMCRESRLPLLTRRKSAFRGVAGLTVLAPEDMLRKKSGATLPGYVRSIY